MRISAHLPSRTVAIAIGAAILTMVCGNTRSAPRDNNVSEYEVKAALVYRTAKFIEWPTAAFAATDAPFVLCVVGNNAPLRPFSALDGKVLNSHKVAVRRITGDMLDVRQCHAAFFAQDAGADVDYALGKLQGAPVLTIGESEEFVQRGGMLALVTREQRVRFTINLPDARRAGLAVNSQLLQLATIVDGGAPK